MEKVISKKLKIRPATTIKAVIVYVIVFAYQFYICLSVYLAYSIII